MKFGVELPTCTAGMMHPVPFATVDDVVDMAAEAEQLGYHDAGGNDHLSTMTFVRDAWPDPPDYFEPLLTLANIAAKTSTLRLTTGIMVLPLREPVLLAKQVATLDQLSHGRVTLGVAVGGYRDEFEAVRPDVAGANRADLTREIVESIRDLWGRDPLPIYSGGNAEGSLRRAAELCEGWLPAKIGPAKIAEGRAEIARYAESVGRDPDTIATALQSVVCIGDTEEQARDKFFNSSFDLFRRSLQSTMTKGVDIDAYLAMNLVGSIDQVIEKVHAYQSAGLDHLTALLFVGNTIDEMREQMRMLARHVMPLFPSRC